ncbi:MAG: 3-deoxy-7-phosphoheptulonate synthase [Spirochaetota bacterium]|nr:3-deoxy-7-phosphoheptulonate synthase [Spirochaetota bacterium]
MILLVNPGNGNELNKTVQNFESKGYKSFMLQTSKGNVCTVLDVNEKDYNNIQSRWNRADSISFLKPSVPYILTSRSIKDTQTIIHLKNNTVVGGNRLVIIGGPCSIESEDQIMKTAESVKSAGAHILRGGAYKPRSSPYAFQGMKEEGLKLLRNAGDIYNMPVITEVLEVDDIPIISEYADILQVGARNCHNFSLLKKLGKTNKPVLLKRGMMTTIEEFLLSAEYILSEGNMNVILCERGIRTFETETRNTLDISAVPILKEKTHLPIIVDPSHAAGSWKLIEPLSMAAVAAGADGLMIEVHNNPESALCDGGQSLKPDRFIKLMKNLKSISKAVSRDFG